MPTIQEITTTLSNRFNASTAGDMSAIFQFVIDGEHYYMTIGGGTCQITPGEHDSPTVTLTMSQATLEELMSGATSGMQAFMMGKLKTQGDMMLATKLGPLFGLS